MTQQTSPLPPNEPTPGAGFQPAAHLLISTPEQLKAISAPLRLSILELIAKEALTVKQIASRLGEAPTKLYYHVAELESAGFVRQVDTRIKSGIIEKYYRASSTHITVAPTLLNVSGEPEATMSDLIALPFESTIQDLSQSAASSLIDLDNPSANAVFARTVVHLRSENAARFIEKFKALLAELDTADDPSNPDAASCACLVAFYPQVEKRSL